jgi:hypothetical protein
MTPDTKKNIRSNKKKNQKATSASARRLFILVFVNLKKETNMGFLKTNQKY